MVGFKPTLLLSLSLLSITPSIVAASPTSGNRAPAARRQPARLPLIADRGVGNGDKTRTVRKRGTGRGCRVHDGSNADAAASASTTDAVTAAAASTASAETSAVEAVNVAIPSTGASTTTSADPAAASSTTSSSSSGNGSTSSLTPNGIKAGIAGGDSYQWMENHIGWWYDWSAAPAQKGTPIAVSMLWGDGALGAEQNDASRLAAFKAMTTTPAYILGFEEPDCTTTGSAGIDVAPAAAVWDSVVAPYKAKGSLLGSPSMCKQADETWLTPFKNAISTQWDFTNIHVNKNNMDGVKKDLDHYWNTYGKPIWVSEFACVDDSNWTPCTDQSEIDTYINDIVALFESDSRVHAYAYSDGLGLGSVWPTVSNGQLSASGQTYLNAISKYH